MSSAITGSVPDFRFGIRAPRGRSRAATDYPRVPGARIKEFHPFRLDAENECLWKHDDHGGEERILMKPKAFGILRFLVDHAGHLATQEEILNAVWPDTYVQPEVLKRHIADIRDVLGDDPKKPAFIETRPWRGYQFIAAVRDAVSATVTPVPARPELMPGDCDPAGLDICALLDERLPSDTRRAALRKEINRLIQERRILDKAIADFECLAASLAVTSQG